MTMNPKTLGLINALMANRTNPPAPSRPLSLSSLSRGLLESDTSLGALSSFHQTAVPAATTIGRRSQGLWLSHSPFTAWLCLMTSVMPNCHPRNTRNFRQPARRQFSTPKPSLENTLELKEGRVYAPIHADPCSKIFKD